MIFVQDEDGIMQRKADQMWWATNRMALLHGIAYGANETNPLPILTANGGHVVVPLDMFENADTRAALKPYAVNMMLTADGRNERKDGKPTMMVFNPYLVQIALLLCDKMDCRCVRLFWAHCHCQDRILFTSVFHGNL